MSMNDPDELAAARAVQRARSAGLRLREADAARKAALREVTEAIGSARELPSADLAVLTGLPLPAVQAIRSGSRSRGTD